LESKTKTKKTRAQIDILTRQALNGLGLAQGDEAVSELKEGWFNVAYNVRLAHGREVILKIATASFDNEGKPRHCQSGVPPKALTLIGYCQGGLFTTSHNDRVRTDGTHRSP